jgi:hypothetical protein
VLFEEVIVMFIGTLALAGLPPESWSCTAKRDNGCAELGVNITVSASGAIAERAEGAGMTVERFTDELAVPLVNEETKAVTLVFPCRIPAVTFTIAKVAPLGITALPTLTMSD